MKRPSDLLKSLSATKKVLLGISVLIIAIAIGNQPTSLNNTKPLHKAQPQSTQPTKTLSITTKTTNEIQSIPFTSSTVQDASLPKGTTKVTTAGVDGSETLTYQITYTNGKQTDKKLTNTAVTSQQIAQVTSVGTYVAPPTKSKCDPNYSGACVPNVYPSDVDCAGGSGNGPYYVQGPVTVTGSDVYGLDRDGNGIGCE